MVTLFLGLAIGATMSGIAFIKAQTLIILVDGATGTMRLLNPAEKAYIVAGPTDPMAGSDSPAATRASIAPG